MGPLEECTATLALVPFISQCANTIPYFACTLCLNFNQAAEFQHVHMILETL